MAASRSGAHLNWMGGLAFDPSDPIARLRMAAASCFFGEPMYYHSAAPRARQRRAPSMGLSESQLGHLRETLQACDPRAWREMAPAELIEQCVDEALAVDPEATLQVAVDLRRGEHIRTTPQVILVRAANHEAVRGTGLVRRYAPAILARADEPAVGLAYQLARFGKPIPNALKRAWRDALSACDDYALAKYQLRGREVSTVDVVNLVHAQSPSIDKLMRGELTMSGRSWEAIVSEEGSSRASWERAVEVMGHMALLRNLRNLLEQGVATSRFLDKLVAGAPTGKQLPFRYYAAWRALSQAGLASEQLRDALEGCMLASMDALPWFEGRTAALCDNSGSAQVATTSAMGSMAISTIANLSALLTGMRSDVGEVGVFGDRLTRHMVDGRAPIFGQLELLETLGRDIGQGTEHGIWLFFEHAIAQREHWDRIFVYSDMQAGHGGLYGHDPAAYREYAFPDRPRCVDVAALVQRYRREVNPRVMVYLVQVAGYQDTLVPEFYERTYVLGGWGPGLLKFADAMSQSYRSQEAARAGS